MTDAKAELSPALPTMGYSNDEQTTLVEMLEYYRAVLARKGSGLTQEQLAVTVAASDLSIGGLLFHMAMVEDNWFHRRLLGKDMLEPWASGLWDDDPDWELHHPSTMTPEQIFAQYDESVGRSRAALAAAESLDQLTVAASDYGGHWNLRWIMVHMIEEYARHVGHADLIRESIDGVVND